MTLSVYETLDGFSRERQDYLRVVVVPGLRGGWDVALRIDGAYSDESVAQEMADYWIGQLVGLFPALKKQQFS